MGVVNILEQLENLKELEPNNSILCEFHKMLSSKDNNGKLYHPQFLSIISQWQEYEITYENEFILKNFQYFDCDSSPAAWEHYKKYYFKEKDIWHGFRFDIIEKTKIPIRLLRKKHEKTPFKMICTQKTGHNKK